MKKLLTQTMVLVIALAIGVSTFAQSPTTALPRTRPNRPRLTRRLRPTL
jgi:hypothetical protein